MALSDRLSSPAPARRLLSFVVCLACLAAGAGAGYWLGVRDPGLRRTAARVDRTLHPAAAGQNLPGQWGPVDAGPSGAAGAAATPAAPAGARGGGLTAKQKAEADKLLSLGYAAGSQPRPKETGVTRHKPELADRGLLFFVSGHAPEALLMTREGEILHRWHADYREVWATDRAAFLAPQQDDATGCWRRAHLFPNGDVLAIFEGHALVKLDRDSRLLWAYPGHCHHDLHVDEDGRIWVLTREAAVVPRLGGDEPVLLDFFTVLDAGGNVERRLSLLEALESSPYASLLDKAPKVGDIFHTNTLERLDGSQAGRSPLFRQGNVLTSIRELNAIAVLDPEREEIVWALTGQWIKQHQPTLLPGGDILLFDNLGHHGRSKVVEIDPFTQEIVWSYADGPDHPLFSRTCGAAQRLPNGNTLIVESDNGRAIEVTPDGRTAWEYRNPHRAGPHDELIAAILDMVALPESFPVAWCESGRVAVH